MPSHDYLRSARTFAFLGLAFAAVVLNLRDGLLPALGLDASWVLATEYAAKHGAAFGKDYVFTYGPYHVIATRLFDPDTFGLVLLYDVLAVLAPFWIAIRHRSLAGAVALCICVAIVRIELDAQSALALFSVFLICLGRTWIWSVLAVALCAPLVLAKLSFGLILLPLLLLADVAAVVARRPPIHVLTLLASAVAAYLLAGQRLENLPAFVSGTLEIVLGYGRAMQMPGPPAERLVAFVVLLLCGGLAGVVALRDWRVTKDLGPRVAAAAALVGFLWALFVTFKMGFVRQDAHTLIFHAAMPGLVAVYFCTVEARAGLVTRLGFAVLFAALVLSAVFWRGAIVRPGAPDALGAELREVASGIPPRFSRGFEWLLGERWEVMKGARAEALASMARRFPPEVQGSVDVAPWDIAEVIASKLDYRPRPVVQSYSAYTPALQRQDMAFFQGPRAPDTLLFRTAEIDKRLPTLAVGPSLPVIAARYDAVASDKLGFVLRRRAEPRPIGRSVGPRSEAPLGQWIPLPSEPGLIMARIRVERSLPGAALGFLYREPMMQIVLRTRSGREQQYRFIPDMARLGVAVSPVPSDWQLGAAILLDPAWAAYADPVVAVRLDAEHNWAFGRRVEVQFERVTVPTGFGARVGALPLLAAQLIASQPGATFNGEEIYAHAPARLEARLDRAVTLTGVAGLHPQPAGSSPGDGVRFRIVEEGPSGARVLFETLRRPGEPPAPFAVAASAGARLLLVTEPVGTTHYDWSYWGRLAVRAAAGA